MTSCPARVYIYVPPPGSADRTPVHIAKVGPFSTAANAVAQVYMTDDPEEAAAWRKALAAWSADRSRFRQEPRLIGA